MNRLGNILARANVQPVQKSSTILVSSSKQSDEIAKNERLEAQRNYENLITELEEYQVANVSFVLMNDNDVLARSVVEVKLSSMDEAAGCVNDIAMGSSRCDSTCTTCKMSYPLCPGHYGHIRLPEPIFHPLLKTEITKLLSIMCQHCGRLRFTDEYVKSLDQTTDPTKRLTRDPTKRVFQLEERVRDMPCAFCKKKSPAIKASDQHSNRVYLSDGSVMRMDRIATLLAPHHYLTPERVKLLGYSNGAHPSHMIINYILVLPRIMRRDIMIDGKISHHDLTHAYSSIVNRCTEYVHKSREGLSDDDKDKLMDRIYNDITRLYTNPENNTNKDKEAKGILDAFKGKEGFNRRGRRTASDARAVLGPVQIPYGYIAVPYKYARTLTMHVPVTQYNIHKVKEWLVTGQVSNVVTTEKGRKCEIKVSDGNRWKLASELKVGDKVNRYLMNGDIVMLNRQPSLEMISMSAYKVMITQRPTIGMHTADTSKHHADNDGDEVNIYPQQYSQSLAEVEEIMFTLKNLSSSQSGKPNIRFVMNILSGAYALTLNETLVDWKLFNECINTMEDIVDVHELITRAHRLGSEMYTANEDGSLKPFDPETSEHPDFVHGRVLFSAVLPPELHYIKAGVIIKDGILVKGTVDKKHLASHGSIQQIIYNDFGSNLACKFLTNVTYVMDNYAYQRGISIGLYDYCPWLGDTEKKEELDAIRESELAKMRGKIKDLVVPPKCEIEAYKKYENKVVEAMDAAVSKIGTTYLSQAVIADSGLSITTRSGAKGSEINVAQTLGVVGPFYNRGERIPLAMSGATRVTPYSVPGTLDVTERDFIQSNYSEGIQPRDCIIASVSTRNTIADTAVGVASSGYLTRRMVVCLEDCITPYTGGVIVNASKNDIANKRILSFVYGDDGTNAEKLDLVKTPMGTLYMPVDVQRIVNRLNARHGVYIDAKPRKQFTGPVVIKQ